MRPGERLYILAIDHRASFEKMVGHDLEVLLAAKMLVWRGFLDALARGARREAAVKLDRGRERLGKPHQRVAVFREDHDRLATQASQQAL